VPSWERQGPSDAERRYAGTRERWQLGDLDVSAAAPLARDILGEREE